MPARPFCRNYPSNCQDMSLEIKRVSTYNDEHEHRADPSLEKTQEESLCVETLKVGACDCQHQANAPDSDDA